MARKPTYEELGKRVKELEKQSLERKRVEQTLLESEQLYRALLDQPADSIVLVEAEILAVLGFNDKAHENVGYSRGGISLYYGHTENI